MSENLSKRIISSILLTSLFLFIIFSHQYIFISSLLILCLIICIESNKMFFKILSHKFLIKKSTLRKFNFQFLILNMITFIYVFLIFAYFSYNLYIYNDPIFFLYIVSICFFTDIGGYIFGKIIGGKKLSKISPNKTISGTIGSFILSFGPLIIISNFSILDLKFNTNNILFILSVSLISQLGDLFISFLKRKAKIKDTGKLLPGHGGVLDRVDGIIFAVPFSFFLLKII